MTGAGAGCPFGNLSSVPISRALETFRGWLSSHCQGWLPKAGVHQVDAWAPAPAGKASEAATRASTPPVRRIHRIGVPPFIDRRRKPGNGETPEVMPSGRGSARVRTTPTIRRHVHTRISHGHVG